MMGNGKKKKRINARRVQQLYRDDWVRLLEEQRKELVETALESDKESALAARVRHNITTMANKYHGVVDMKLQHNVWDSMLLPWLWQSKHTTVVMFIQELLKHPDVNDVLVVGGVLKSLLLDGEITTFRDLDIALDLQTWHKERNSECRDSAYLITKQEQVITDVLQAIGYFDDKSYPGLNTNRYGGIKLKFSPFGSDWQVGAGNDVTALSVDIWAIENTKNYDVVTTSTECNEKSKDYTQQQLRAIKVPKCFDFNVDALAYSLRDDRWVGQCDLDFAETTMTRGIELSPVNKSWQTMAQQLISRRGGEKDTLLKILIASSGIPMEFIPISVYKDNKVLLEQQVELRAMYVLRALYDCFKHGIPVHPDLGKLLSEWWLEAVDHVYYGQPAAAIDAYHRLAVDHYKDERHGDNVETTDRYDEYDPRLWSRSPRLRFIDDMHTLFHSKTWLATAIEIMVQEYLDYEYSMGYEV